MTRCAVLLLAAAAGCATYRPAPAQVVARGVAPDPPAAADVKALETTVRDLLVKNLPDPLVTSAPGWGRQEEGLVGVKFHRDGLKLKSETVRGPRNDGAWRKVSVRVPNPASLTLAITDAAHPDRGRSTFTATLAADCDLRFEQQLWRNGTRLYSGETRARCRATTVLACEATSRTETPPGSFLPDVVFRVKVTDARLSYDRLVVEHTAGVGGDAARVLGDTVLDAVKAARPNLERDLLAKANAAVVRAADTREVRVSVAGLFR